MAADPKQRPCFVEVTHALRLMLAAVGQDPGRPAGVRRARRGVCFGLLLPALVVPFPSPPREGR